MVLSVKCLLSIMLTIELHPLYLWVIKTFFWRRCRGGDEDIGEDDRGVAVDRCCDDGPDSVPAPPGERRESPPSSSSSLTFSLDGIRVYPLVHGFHGGGGARGPPRLDLSLCLSLFLCSRF
jgi:hypothetical protein